MGQLISLITVALFSATSLAQNLGPIEKTDFSPLIDQNVLEQELAAEGIQHSTLTATNVENEHELVESVKTIPTENAATHVQVNPSTETRKPANEKDFQVKLHPTGISSAKRYFPPKPKVVKTPKKARTKVAKNDKKVKSKKSKGNGRSTASIKKKAKKSARTSSSAKI